MKENIRAEKSECDQESNEMLFVQKPFIVRRTTELFCGAIEWSYSSMQGRPELESLFLTNYNEKREVLCKGLAFWTKAHDHF